jgi:hypothetical protein
MNAAEGGLDRRAFLRGAGGMGLLAFVPLPRLQELLAAAPAAGQHGRFLTAHELDALRAVTARFLPGPPEDPDPGAVEAGAAEAIDLLLAAFTFHPPLIHAGGPFSNRNGPRHDDFADFVPLDAHAELGWRIRIEGSRGRKEREFAGPVKGLQQLCREGLAHLDVRANGSFATLPAPLQDAILSDQTDGDVQTFVGMALALTVEAVYGPPEYGGNRNLVGWKPIHWRGDTQPLGFTNEEVGHADPARGAPLAADAAQRALERFLPAMVGAAASRDAYWTGRPGLNRG